MAKNLESASDSRFLEDAEKPKFSQSVKLVCTADSAALTLDSFLTSDIVVVTVAKSSIFKLHLDLLVAESEKYFKTLTGPFKEAAERAFREEDEDPELFGFFVEYIYRDRSILSRKVQHYSEYVTLARLYAMGERLMARTFKEYCLWRFTESLGTHTVSEEGICLLLEIACTEISERVKEDPMRSQIFWYGGTKIAALQKSSMFRQMLLDIPDLGRQLSLWVNQSQPSKAAMPNELLCQRFGPESEYSLKKTAEMAPEVKEGEWKSHWQITRAT
ncbi:hypothetical protein BKA66DRAFT_600368 [Pyrenochaeta sp. MPI-SDFR-AT-0127]|nr:hypothetical protein BKA66DRAFT_600368 [Pyrenochaeta sp. MPI-SDFR-AT-0127]